MLTLSAELNNSKREANQSEALPLRGEGSSSLLPGSGSVYSEYSSSSVAAGVSEYSSSEYSTSEFNSPSISSIPAVADAPATEDEMVIVHVVCCGAFVVF